MVDYVRDHLKGETPRCRLEYAAADMTRAAERRALFDRAAAAAGNGWVLVIAEGLLIYLQPEQVAELSQALAAQPAFRRWLIDLASDKLLKWLQRSWGKRLKQGGSPMIFGPAEGTRFFEPQGWKEREFRSSWEESFRLNRKMPNAWLWQLFSKLQPAAKREAGRRMAGIVLLERRQATAGSPPPA